MTRPTSTPRAAWLTRTPGIAALLGMAALVGAATAVALPAASVGTIHLKSFSVTGRKLAANAVSGGKVANESLTGADIREGTLGTVPRATQATRASTASNVTGSSRIARRLATTTGADYATASAAAPLVALGTWGPFTITARCFRVTGNTQYLQLHLATSATRSMMESGIDDKNGRIEANYLEPSTLLEDRQIGALSIATGNTSITGAGAVTAWGRDGTFLQASFTGGIDNVSPAGSQGGFGAGAPCWVAGDVTTRDMS